MNTPEFLYYETIGESIVREGKYINQAGGACHYGHVVLRIEPLANTTAVVCENQTDAQTIPATYLPAIYKGIQDSAGAAGYWGYSLCAVRVTVIGGSWHPVDSSESAYWMAARRGLEAGIQKIGRLLVRSDNELIAEEPVPQPDPAGYRQRFAEIVDSLRSPDEQARKAAVAMLQEDYYRGKAVDLLKEALQDPDNRVSTQAHQALAALGLQVEEPVPPTARTGNQGRRRRATLRAGR